MGFMATIIPRHSSAATTWNPLLRTAMVSWQLNGIMRMQSGQNYTITGNTATGTRRADYNGGNARYGSAGPGIVPRPGLQLFNIAPAKNFRVRERYTLRFQTDFFNALNSVNLTGAGRERER